MDTYEVWANHYNIELYEHDRCRQFNIKRQARSGSVYGGVILALKNHRKIGISRTVILPNFAPLYRGDNINFIPFGHTWRVEYY